MKSQYIIWIVFLGIVICNTFTSGCNRLPGLSKEPSLSKVSSEIASFLDDSELDIAKVRKRTTAYGDVHVYKAELRTGGSVLFDVDDEGKIIGFMRLDQNGTTVNLSQNEAISIAVTFASRSYPDPSLLSLPPDEAELVELQANNKYYVIKWIGKDKGSGALLPQSIQMQVNAQTGEINSFGYIYEPVLIDTEPSITETMAKQIALDASQGVYSSPSSDHAILLVSNYPFMEAKSKQSLLWQVIIIGDDDVEFVPQLVVYIDAITGEIKQLERIR